MRFHLSPSPRDGRHKGPRAVSQQLCVLERVTPPGATPPAQSRIRETTAPLLPDLEQRLRTGPEIAQEAGRPNSPWHLLGSPASTRSAVHPSLPSLCLNHKVIQPLPALTNHLGKRPRKYGSGGRKLGQKIVVKVGQRTGRKRSLMQWAVENATLDWLVGGRVTSLLGSKVGLLGVLSFKSGPVLFFAPGPRVFGNS